MSEGKQRTKGSATGIVREEELEMRDKNASALLRADEGEMTEEHEDENEKGRNCREKSRR